MPIEPIDPRLRLFADGLQPAVEEQFLRAVLEVQKVIPVEELVAAIRAGQGDRVIELVMMLAERRFLVELQPVARMLDAIGVVGAGALDGGFNLMSAKVQQEIQLRSGRLIREISEGTRTMVRRIINGAYLEGMNPVTQGRLIRQVVGVAPNHAGTVGRYVADLAGSGIDLTEVDRLADLYTKRLRNYRANSIARTEVINAQVGGRYQEWLDRASRGVIQIGRVWVEWVVTEDDRLCKWCAPMDGQRVRLNEMFVSEWVGFEDFIPDAPEERSLRPDPMGLRRDELGQFISKKVEAGGLVRRKNGPEYVLHPPLHPMCRCDVVLRFED